MQFRRRILIPIRYIYFLLLYVKVRFVGSKSVEGEIMSTNEEKSMSFTANVRYMPPICHSFQKLCPYNEIAIRVRCRIDMAVSKLYSSN